MSSNPILYAELPGAQHSFDLFHSVRFETVIDGIEAFAAWVRSQHRPGLSGVSDHRAGVLGWMFLLLWNTFAGSYLAFTSASRRYVSSP